jgi:hypothetical protein
MGHACKVPLVATRQRDMSAMKSSRSHMIVHLGAPRLSLPACVHMYKRKRKANEEETLLNGCARIIDARDGANAMFTASRPGRRFSDRF